MKKYVVGGFAVLMLCSPLALGQQPKSGDKQAKAPPQPMSSGMRKSCHPIRRSNGCGIAFVLIAKADRARQNRLRDSPSKRCAVQSGGLRPTTSAGRPRPVAISMTSPVL